MACSESGELPKGILPEKKMVTLLIDLHWSDAKIAQSAYTNTDSAQYNYWKLETAIFKRNKTDTLTFRKSLAYYSQTPKRLEEIYAIVIDSLSYRESVAKTKTNKKNKSETKKDTSKIEK
jgi:hypothetical protein